MKDKKKIAIILAIIVAIIIALIVFLLLKNTKTMYAVSFFETENGKLLTVQEVQKGKTATKPEDPTIEGYQFLDWYLGEEIFDFSTPIKSNLNIIAKWQSNPTPISAIYTITLNVDGEKTIVKTDENGLIKEPQAPTKTGYTFQGWFAGNEKVDFSKAFTSDNEIVAKWEKVVEETKQDQTKKDTTKKEANTTKTNTKTNTKTKTNTNTNTNTKTNTSSTSQTSSGSTSSTTGSQSSSASTNADSQSSTSGNTESTTLDPTPTSTPTVTYTYQWEDIKTSVAGQSMLYILANGEKTSGTATVTTKSGKTSTVSIPASGKMYVKDAVQSVTNLKGN